MHKSFSPTAKANLCFVETVSHYVCLSLTLQNKDELHLEYNAKRLQTDLD